MSYGISRDKERIDALYNNISAIEAEPFGRAWKFEMQKQYGGWLQWNNFQWEWHYIEFDTEYNGGRVAWSLEDIAENCDNISTGAIAEAAAVDDGIIWEDDIGTRCV